MMQVVFLLTALLALVVGVKYENEWTSPDEHYQILRYCGHKKISELELEDPSNFRRVLFVGGVPGSIPPQIKVSNVTVTTCENTSDYPMKVDLRVLGETPMPGYVKFAFDINSTIDIISDVTMEIEASKKILGDLVRLPCINNIGSCVFTKPCQITREMYSCPENFARQHIPCTCPVVKGRYQSEKFKLFVGISDVTDIPGWLTDGHYEAEINIRSAMVRLACLKTEMDIIQL